jgi:hypothetical protein
MKHLFLIPLTLLVSSAVALADPVTDFVAKLVNSSSVSSKWTGESDDEPNGGYLFRFAYDIDGDGTPEWFVSSSMEADKHACSWAVYKKGAGDTYDIVGTNVILNPDEGFYLTSFNNIPQIKTIFVKPPNFGVIKIYSFGADGKIGAITRKLSAAEANQLINDDNAEQIFQLGEAKKPAIEKILLAEYLKVPQAQWRPYKADLGILAQQKDPADATALSYTNQFGVDDGKALAAARLQQ